MKVIFVNSCGDCPYRSGRQCSNTTLDVTRHLQKGFGENCFLQNFNNTTTAPRKRTKKTVVPEVKKTVNDIYQMYRKYCPSLKEFDIDKLTDSKFMAIYETASHVGFDNLEQLFKMVNDSAFLTGKNGWSADFEWIMRPSHRGLPYNADKILSGKYTQKNLGINNVNTKFKDGERVYDDVW